MTSALEVGRPAEDDGDGLGPDPFALRVEAGELVALLSGLASSGAAVVVSSHQLDLADRATRRVGLRDGACSYDGPASTDAIRALVG